MISNEKLTDWSTIETKLKREKKADLICLIQELTAVSPEAQRFLQTRYLKKKTPKEQIAPYLQVIKAQFVISEWNNTISWDFAGVQKAIDDFDKSSGGDEAGLCELLLVALETAVSFADNFSMQDDDFDEGVTELAERFVKLFTESPQQYSQQLRRIQKIEKTGNALGYYALGETLDEITNPHR